MGFLIFLFLYLCVRDDLSEKELEYERAGHENEKL